MLPADALAATDLTLMNLYIDTVRPALAGYKAAMLLTFAWMLMLWCALNRLCACRCS